MTGQRPLATILSTAFTRCLFLCEDSCASTEEKNPRKAPSLAERVLSRPSFSLLFSDADIVGVFVSHLHNAVEKHACQALIYCFMPEHLHVIVRGVAAHSDTWRAVVDFKQQIGYWLKSHRSTSSMQKDFHDHIIRDPKDLGDHVRYVANNPVRRGLVKDWRDYRFTGSIGIDLETVMADCSTM